MVHPEGCCHLPLTFGLTLDDSEDGDLIHTDDEQEKADEDGYSIVAMWNWERKNYFLKG